VLDEPKGQARRAIFPIDDHDAVASWQPAAIRLRCWATATPLIRDTGVASATVFMIDVAMRRNIEAGRSRCGFRQTRPISASFGEEERTRGQQPTTVNIGAELDA